MAKKRILTASVRFYQPKPEGKIRSITSAYDETINENPLTDEQMMMVFQVFHALEKSGIDRQGITLTVRTYKTTN